MVYCKTPFKDPGRVVEYLGRYTHRVAISNNRIVRVHNGMVTFKWRDYKDHNRQKLMSLTTDEFIRRFLVHVLPTGFMRIRHYGLLSPRNKSVKLALCKKLTKTTMREKFTAKLSTVELFEKLRRKMQLHNVCLLPLHWGGGNCIHCAIPSIHFSSTFQE